eukprot:scaffold180235_cov24-Tisochrysis_lutea.AAC.1
MEEPHALKANEMAEVVFAPCQPLIVDSFKNCEGLSRIAFLDGNTAVMLGKVVSTNMKWGRVCMPTKETDETCNVSLPGGIVIRYGAIAHALKSAHTLIPGLSTHYGQIDM